MRICFLGDAGHINLLSWMKYFMRLGHEIHIISFNRPCEDVNGINLHLIDNIFKKNKIRYLLSTGKVKKAIDRIQPDIIIGYRVTSYGFMAVNTGFHPVVVVAQGSDLFYPRNSKMQKALVRYTINKADLLHTWASHMSDKWSEYGVKEDKILVLPKGVDTNIFRHYERKGPEGSLILISTRQLRKTYNYDCILKALPLALKNIPNLKYLICGDGEYRDNLELAAKNLRLENNIRFMGKIRHDELPSFLNSSYIYVSMQESDGVSSSLLEAMSCGIFPIVTDIKANRLWIDDGSNGFLIPVNDHLELARKIIAAYENPKLRQEAKSKNIALVKEKASITSNTIKVVDLYSKLVDNFRNGKNKSL